MGRGRISARRSSAAAGALCLASSVLASLAVGAPASSVPGLPPKIHALPIEATIPVPGSPGGIGVGLGSVWVASMSEGVLYRIDPATNETIGSVRYAAAGNPRSGVEDPVAVGGGSVWVASARDDRLVKIDPERMRVVWKRHVPSLWAVAYAGSSVWVAQLDSNLVARVDPETGRVKTRATAVGPTDLAPGPGRVWALEHRGSALLGLSTRTGKKAAQVSFEARAPERLAIGSGAAWISDTLGWLVVRVDTSAPNKTRPILMPGGGETMPGNMAAGGGHVWVATIQSHVLRIDPLRNRVDAGAQINAAPKCAQPRTGCVLDVAYGEGSVWVGDTHARTVVRLSAAP